MITYEQIKSLYIDQGLTFRETANELHVSHNSLRKYMDHYQIHKTPEQIGQDIVKKRLKNPKISKEVLEDLYITQNKSVEDIKSLYKISRNKLKALIDLYGIKKDPKLINEGRSKVFTSKHPQLAIDIKELYINQNKSSSEVQKLLNISGNLFDKICKKYNIVKDTKIIKDNRKSTLQANLLKKFGVDNVMHLPQVQKKRLDTIHERYNGKHYASCEEWKKKHHETRTKRKSWNTSKFEEYVYSELVKIFPDTKRQYRSELYPYACDFYIPDIDTYIEIQGSAFHGPEPFDELNENHQALITKLLNRNTSYALKQIDQWTIKDVEKRKIAKENQLNFFEFYKTSQFDDWFKQYKEIY